MKNITGGIAGIGSRLIATVVLLLMHVFAAPVLYALGYSEIGGSRFFGVHTVAVSSRALSLSFKGDPEIQHIAVEAHDLPTRYRVESERDGGVVRVRIVGDMSPSASALDARVIVRVPTEMQIIATTSYGDISVEGLESGRVQLASGTGTVLARDSSVEAVLETESGQIVLQRVSGEAVLTAGRGDIMVRRFTGSLTAHSTLGSQFYEEFVGDLSMSTNSGALRITGLEGSLTATSTHGPISAEGVRLESESQVRSLAGDLILRFANTLDELNLEIDTGSEHGVRLNGTVYESPTDRELVPGIPIRVSVGSGRVELYTEDHTEHP